MILKKAVEKTVSYANHFGDNPTPEDIHFWLISPTRHSISSVKKCLSKDYKPKNENFGPSKIVFAKKLVSKLSKFPLVRMVGITGSVAAKNAKKTDDIDILVVARSNSLWLLRPFLLIYSSLFFKRRKRTDSHTAVQDMFCFNLWLDETSLKMDRESQNLYVAREVLQLIPILNRYDTYEKLIYQNIWTKKFLANAYAYTTKSLQKPTILQPKITIADFFLFLPNLLFYICQLAYMSPHKTRERVDLHSAYLHTTDYHKQITSRLH